VVAGCGPAASAVIQAQRTSSGVEEIVTGLVAAGPIGEPIAQQRIKSVAEALAEPCTGAMPLFGLVMAHSGQCKGPSAHLSTRKVVSDDSTEVVAGQGSTAYLWQELRVDTRLTDTINADPVLREGLLNGTVKVEYRLVQPDAAGHIKVTDFKIEQDKLDIPGWLGAPPG